MNEHAFQEMWRWLQRELELDMTAHHASHGAYSFSSLRLRGVRWELQIPEEGSELRLILWSKYADDPFCFEPHHACWFYMKWNRNEIHLRFHQAEGGNDPCADLVGKVWDALTNRHPRSEFVMATEEAPDGIRRAMKAIHDEVRFGHSDW